MKLFLETRSAWGKGGIKQGSKKECCFSVLISSIKRAKESAKAKDGSKLD